jgi:hypothetical protein
MSSLEYLYWYEGFELKHFVGTFREIAGTCKDKGAPVYYSYSIHLQFKQPWHQLNASFQIVKVLRKLEDVPPDIRALHLLIHRGDYE